VPKTLLAVDDSATMRKVLEITFSGEDYRIVTVDSSQAAIAKLSEEPKIFIIDTVLGSDDGYALSKEVRKRDGSATIVLLASRHNPYDAAKGKDAGADDYMDKPFDTQQMVDKVRKAVVARESGAVAAPAAAADVVRTQIGVPVAPPAARPAAAAPAPAPAAPAAAAAKPAPAAAAAAAGSRASTLMFGGEPQTKPGTPAAPPPAAAAKPAPAPAAARPAPAPAPAAAASPAPPKVAPAAAAAPPAAAAVGVAAKVNGQLSSKLGELGLTAQQVEGVLALSRDVVERVVWEVVPELAEALIKEEIARLMKA
jgi:CheY-like chemotaxis protein